MNHLSKTGKLLLMLGLSLSIFAASPRLHAQTPAADGTQFLSPSTALYSWIDIEKCDPTDPEIKSLLQLNERDQVYLQGLKGSGARRVWMVGQIKSMMSGELLLVFESTSTKKTEEYLTKTGWMATASDGKFVYAGTNSKSIEGIRQSFAKPSKNMESALAKCDQPFGLIFAVPDNGTEYKTLLMFLGSIGSDEPLKIALKQLETASYALLQGEFKRPKALVSTKMKGDQEAATFAGKMNEYLESTGKKNLPRINASGSEVLCELQSSEHFHSIFDLLGREDARTSVSLNSLKQIMLAIHTFEGNYKKLPPQALASKDGKKLLSWRVLLLPYIEQKELYEQFKLDEPWDSDHNKKLISKMPDVYKSQGGSLGEGKTRFVAPLTKSSFMGKTGGALQFRDITDGSSNTLAIVEASPENAVIWTKPEDVTVDLKKVFVSLFGDNAEKGLVTMLDGSARKISNQTTNETWEQLLSLDGGEILDFDAIK